MGNNHVDRNGRIVRISNFLTDLIHNDAATTSALRYTISSRSKVKDLEDISIIFISLRVG